MQYKYDEKSIDTLLYIASKPSDYFVMILQGKCSVEIGNDHLKFEAGPFFTFGAEALIFGGRRVYDSITGKLLVSFAIVLLVRFMRDSETDPRLKLACRLASKT